MELTTPQIDLRLKDLNGIFTANATAIIEVQGTAASSDIIEALQRTRNDTIILTNFAILVRELIVSDSFKDLADASRQSIESNMAQVDEFISLARQNGVIE